LAFAPDNQSLILAIGPAAGPSRFPNPGGKGQAGEAQIWNLKTNSLVSTLHGQGPISTLVFAPGDRTLACGGISLDGKDGEVRLWLVSEAKGGCVLDGHAGPVGCAAYSPDGKTLATGGHDKTIRLWDVESGQERASLKGFANAPHRLRFTPDGKVLAVVCRSEKVVTLWTLAGKTALAGHTLEVSDLAFAPEGRRLATAAGGDKAGEVKLWDLDAGREIAALPKHAQAVRSVAFAPDGRTLAVACGKDVSLWDPATSTELKKWQLPSPVCQVAYAPGGATLAVGLETGTVTLHHSATGRALATLEGQSGALCSLSFSPDGKMLVAAVKEGRPKVWQLP
jgi:WD40 repeat protein